MAYEVVPFSNEAEVACTGFQSIIYDQITKRGDDNHPLPDRYQPNEEARDYDYKYCQTGEVTFGETWLIHHLDLDNLQLIYAFKPPTIYRPNEAFAMLARLAGEPVPQTTSEVTPSRAEFYVHEFGKRGLAVRTEFTELVDNVIQKSRETMFASSFGLGFTEFSKKLEPAEQEEFKAAIAEPEISIEALKQLVSLSRSEKQVVQQALKNHTRQMRKHQEELEEIARYHRTIGSVTG